MDNLRATNIKYVKGVGPAKAAMLAKLNIFTVGDLLEHYPRRYEDRSQLKLIRALQDNELQTFKAVVAHIQESKPRRGLTLTKITVRDESALAQLVWFNQPFIKKWYQPGMEVIVTGKVERRYGQIQISHPEIEVLDGADLLHTGRVVPIYPSSENIGQRWLRSLVRQALDSYGAVDEILPPEVIADFELLDRRTALEKVHFPDDLASLEQARRRLVFEELYLLQCGLLLLKSKNKQAGSGIKHAPDGALVGKVAGSLPFALTRDQQAALADIRADMEDILPMQRLVQGDVGSGKTVLAAIALAKTVENGYQGAMMAPTEILAEQHYHTLAQLLAPQGIRIAVLTGRLTRRIRDEVLDRVRHGLVDVVVGTHALIQEDVEFQQLGLVVTDEQHRFGVRQRALLQAKGTTPDVLVMTATPIPRTMALTVYGDLDVSVIRELPPGRKPIKTYSVGGDMRERIYNFVVKEVNGGRQAYVVCPLVEESEKLEAQAATQLYEELQGTFLRQIPCGLVHGKLKAQDKERVMNDFYSGAIKVLVATTVIEVGVNVPNASVMVVEGADRFGLAQLHQLRGRIGRGGHQSYCILLSDSRNPETRERLDILAQVQDGFVLAEKDLALRGPGQFFGTRQHGIPDLKIADIVKDINILLDARRAAQDTVAQAGRLNAVRPALGERFGNHFGMIFQN
ncbi:MAG TPA: ATP-dependent DNA helicase RecG [Selenomonadales bacterium]|nr:ATP-dependent DNA helicase RecG [Selenomonadales bacterium]